MATHLTARGINFTMQSNSMDDLKKALADISTIRRQVAVSTEFRGYGPATLAVTGVVAAVAALIEATWLPDAMTDVSHYLGIWLAAAVVSSGLAGAQMLTRSRRMHSSLSNEMIRMAVEQFLPAAIAGALITAVVMRSAPASVWILPGIWQILFSLGILASCRFLPRWMALPGAWYMVSGLVCLSLGDSRALSAWAMGIPFVVGQLLVALVLYFGSQEARHDS